MRIKKMLGVALLVLLGLAIVVVIYDVWQIKFGGKPVRAPIISREAQVFGAGGELLNYVVMGDSTAVSQGSSYDQGYAVHTAAELGKKYRVSLINVGVSGARTSDVASTQLEQVARLKPDLVLIAIGANDVTHNTNPDVVQRDIERTVDALISLNCNVKIVLTGAAAMGSVPRLPQPLRLMAAHKTNSLNARYKAVVQAKGLTFAAVADKTGPAFASDPTLFAQDKFHPNGRGYQLWTDAITPSLTEALQTQASHCKR